MEGGITVTNPEIARTTRCSLGDWHLLRVIDFRPSTHTVLIESSATLPLKFISYNANCMFYPSPKRRKIIISFIQCYSSVGHVDMMCGEVVVVCRGDMSVRYVVVVWWEGNCKVVLPSLTLVTPSIIARRCKAADIA